MGAHDVLTIHDAAWIQPWWAMIHHELQWWAMINHDASEALMTHNENTWFWFRLPYAILSNLCSIQSSVWIGFPLRCMLSQPCFNATTASFVLLVKRVHVITQKNVFAIHRCGHLFIANENLKLDLGHCTRIRKLWAADQWTAFVQVRTPRHGPWKRFLILHFSTSTHEQPENN